MENHLKVLEERISKAVSFIENLKTREKTLRDEKDAVGRRVEVLESQIKEKEKTIAELRESQVFLKSKIETILSKLESLANLELEAETEEREGEQPAHEMSAEDADTSGEGGNAADEEEATFEDDEPEVQYPSTHDTSEIYVEENIVDLKSDEEEENHDGSSAGSAQNPLFESIDTPERTDGDRTGEQERFQNTHEGRKYAGGKPFTQL
jgi:chromosome segregation ATPase